MEILNDEIWKWSQSERVRLVKIPFSEKIK
jgi:hypothetical protein